MKEIQPLLIAFAGPAQVGKDYVAEGVQRLVKDECYKRYNDKDIPVVITIRGFADNMKEILSDRLDIDKNWFYHQTKKELARPLLQAYPEFMKIYHNDQNYWVNMYEGQLDYTYPTIYLVKDLRYSQEADMVSRHGGEVVQLQSDNYETTKHTNHSSEAGIPETCITEYFFNNRNISMNDWDYELRSTNFFNKILDYIETHKDFQV